MVVTVDTIWMSEQVADYPDVGFSILELARIPFQTQYVLDTFIECRFADLTIIQQLVQQVSHRFVRSLESEIILVLQSRQRQSLVVEFHQFGKT